jgi:hypothetical protein
MSQIIKLSLFLLLLFCIYAFVSGCVAQGVDTGIYYAVMGTASLFFPVIIYVALYHVFLRNRLNYPVLATRFLVKSFVMIMISLLGLLVWAILEYIVLSGFQLDTRWIWDDYKDEYLGFMPIVIVLALLIPVGHHYFFAKKQDK